jgi:periplasmic protein TonB
MIAVILLAFQSASTAGVSATPVAAPAPPPIVAEKLPPHRPVQPRTSPSRWFSDADYPPRARRNEEFGTTLYRLTISPEGRVSACSIIRSSGSASLDVETCKLATRRARFNSATDADGNPVEGEFRGYVEWGVRYYPPPIAELEPLKRPPAAPKKPVQDK